MKSYKDEEIILLVTATVTPQYNYMAQSPSERLQDYITAITWYMENTPYRMVIGENSGCFNLLESIDEHYHKRIELICYHDTDSSRNYGYNEMVILEKCNEKSVFLKEAQLIAKITGRNIIRNINLLIGQIRKPRGHFFAAEIGLKLLYINARCFFFTSSMWPAILAKKEGVGGISHDEIKAGKTPTPGIYVDVETAYGALIREELRKDTRSFRMLRYPLDISGTSGYYGSKIDWGKKKKIVRYIKTFFKYVFWQVLSAVKRFEKGS